MTDPTASGDASPAEHPAPSSDTSPAAVDDAAAAA